MNPASTNQSNLRSGFRRDAAVLHLSEWVLRTPCIRKMRGC